MLLRPSGGAAPQPIHGAAPRILQLLPDAPPQSLAETAVQLAEGLSALGGASVVAGGDSRTEATLRRNGVDHRPFRAARDALFHHSSTQALLDTVHHRGIDMIHVHGAEAGVAARGLADAANLPLVMSCDSLPRASGFLARRSARRMLTGKPIVVRSAHAASCLHRDFAVPKADIRLILPGVNAAHYDAAAVASARTADLVAAWGIAEDTRPLIVVPEAQADAAWLDWVLHAAAHVDAPEALWLLSGDDAMTEEAIARINRSPALGRVRWVGPCPDWAAAYKLAALVVCLPQAGPTVSAHALHAQAMGRAVVASDVGANSEAIQPGKTGWMVRNHDAGSLVYAVSAAMDREGVIRDAMSLAARSMVRSRFGQYRMQQETFALYDEVRAAHRGH